MNEQEAVETEVVEPAATKGIPKQEVPKVEATLIPIDSTGRVVARNNSELIRYCGALISGEGVPERFDTPTKLFAALMFVRDLKLADSSIRQVANIYGNMCIFGDLPLALVQRTKELTYFREQWFDKEYNYICFENKNLDAETHGAVCFAKRGPHGDPQSFAFTLADARKAGIYPPKFDTQPWARYTKLMLRYKARAIALKSLFADAINGVSIAEYDFDVCDPESDLKDVTPSSKASDLNQRINDLRQAADATKTREAGLDV